MFVCHVCHVCVLERKMRKMSVQTHVRVCARKIEIFYPCALKFASLDLAFSPCLFPFPFSTTLFSSPRMKNRSFVRIKNEAFLDKKRTSSARALGEMCIFLYWNDRVHTHRVAA